jgi:hypothetical protein
MGVGIHLHVAADHENSARRKRRDGPSISTHSTVSHKDKVY